jgi:hypothetical protein
VGDLPADEMVVSSAAASHFYELRSVQYAIPEPACAALVLAPVVWCLRRRRVVA